MNSNILNKELLDNEFTINFITVLAESLRGVDKKDGFSYSSNNYQLLNKKERYLADIHVYHTNLIYTIEQLDYIRVFLKRFPAKKFYQNNDINQLSYIQYHLEVLIHKIHTISEIMRLLVNEVYMLKIDPRDCSWKKLVSKIGVENPSMIAIDKYYKTFEKYINIRNKNSHRGIFNDSQKDKINLNYGLSIYEQYEKLGLELDDDFKRLFPKFMIDYKIKEYKKHRIEMVIKIQSMTYKFVKEFLTSLNEKFNENLATI